MKLLESLKLAAVWAACTGLVSPVATFGAAPSERPSKAIQSAASLIRDVALTRGGTLAGQVVDADGNPLSGVSVVIQRPGQSGYNTTTDARGHFAVGGLKGGTYQVIAGQQVSHYRVWTAPAAPPSATAGMLLVARDDVVVRGQYAPPAGPPGAVYGGPGPGACGPGGDCGVVGDCYGNCGPVAGPGVAPVGRFGAFGWLANPWIVGAAIAAGIAIPLALDDDNGS